MDELSSAVIQYATAGGLSVNYSRCITAEFDLTLLSQVHDVWLYAFFKVVPRSALLGYRRWSDAISQGQNIVFIELV